MPELPEVETVKETLKKHILNKTIKEVLVYHNNIISYPSVLEFKNKLIDQTIINIKRQGKWLMFELNDYYLLSHLRMEGKYFIKKDEPITKHQHVIFKFSDGYELRYQDTRKFGKMYLYLKDEVYDHKPLNELGYEPWDKRLTVSFLEEKYKNKKLPIKTTILDQTIISGLGNIYADEVLFLSRLHPLTKACQLNHENLREIIENSKKTLEKAIKLGGTTIRSYESSEGVHGRFQNELLVHTKKNCPNCNSLIHKIKVNGRGTYYCPNCQKNHSN